MPQNISVVIIDTDFDSIKNLVKYIENIGDTVVVEGTASTFEKGYEIVHKKRPMVVIMEVGDDINLAIERIGQLSSRFPQVSIFATATDKSSDTILKVMRAGATEYLLRPVSDSDLAFALQKMGRLWLVKLIWFQDQQFILFPFRELEWASSVWLVPPFSPRVHIVFVNDKRGRI